MKSWKRRVISGAFLILSATVIFLVVANLDSPALVGEPHTNTWFSLVNLNHNGFHSWRIDHLTRFAAWLFPAYSFSERPLIGTLLILLGTYWFLRQCDAHRRRSPMLPWIGAVAATVTILLITGFDPVVIGAVAWLPLITVCAYAAMTQPQPALSRIALAVVSIESSYSANQAALISAATALWITYLLTLPSQTSRRRLGVVCAIALLPALLSTIAAPLPDLPNYPRSAHVLPFDGVNGTLRPLVGPAYQFETLDRAAMRLDYGSRAVTLFLLAILAWWTRRRHQTAVARYTGKVGLVLILIATLSASLPEPWATISPLPSISRMLPWGTSYSITSVALGLGTWMTVTSLVLNLGIWGLMPTIAAALVITSYGSPNIFSPLLRRNGTVADSKLRPLLLSPSAALFRSLALSPLDASDRIEAIRMTSRIPGKDIQEFNAQVEVQPPASPEALEKARVAESAWRWSSRTGAQRGEESLTIRLKTPATIRGLELDPGPFFTDFPRGLKITGGPCEAASAPTLAEYPIWQGTLHVLPRGIPYYSPRNEVRVVFPTATTVSCLFIYQTGQAPYDWSVSKITLFVVSQ